MISTHKCEKKNIEISEDLHQQLIADSLQDYLIPPLISLIKEYAQTPALYILQNKKDPEKLAQYCLSLLREKRRNDVAILFEKSDCCSLLTTEDYNYVMSYWKDSYPFLYAYYTGTLPEILSHIPLEDRDFLNQYHLPKALLHSLDIKFAEFGDYVSNETLLSKFSLHLCSPKTNFAYDNLIHVNFRKAGINGAKFANADLHGANFKEAHACSTNFENAKLYRANLQHAILKKSNFRKADLVLARLNEAHLENAIFDHAKLGQAKLVGAILTGASLQKCDLDEANLDQANLENANFTRADLEDATLRRSNLKKANFFDARLKNAVLTQADLSYARLNEANLRYAHLKGANLTGAILYDANLQDADLSQANLTGAILHDADLQDADLSQANLTNAVLFGADLYGTNLEGANLVGADLRNVHLEEREAQMIARCVNQINLAPNHYAYKILEFCKSYFYSQPHSESNQWRFFQKKLSKPKLYDFMLLLRILNENQFKSMAKEVRDTWQFVVSEPVAEELEKIFPEMNNCLIM